MNVWLSRVSAAVSSGIYTYLRFCWVVCVVACGWLGDMARVGECLGWWATDRAPVVTRVVRIQRIAGLCGVVNPVNPFGTMAVSAV